MLDSGPRRHADVPGSGQPPDDALRSAERVAEAPDTRTRPHGFCGTRSFEVRFCPHFVTFANNRMRKSRNGPRGLRHNRSEMPTPSEHQPQHPAPGRQRAHWHAIGRQRRRLRVAGQSSPAAPRLADHPRPLRRRQPRLDRHHYRQSALEQTPHRRRDHRRSITASGRT